MVGLSAAALALAAATVTGTLASPDVDELSGLAFSRSEPQVLWGHNDTGSGPVLHRIGADGANLGRVLVPEAVAGDWEDIAAFDDRGGPALLVADVGDNFALRAFSTLYAVEDPGRATSAAVRWRLDFSYPDGPRDCEAVAVDPLAREILLLTKRDTPARLYRLPLPKKPPRSKAMAEFVGTIAPPPAPSDNPVRRWAERYDYMPTGLDISADGLTAAIVTPARAWVYRRTAGQPWLERFREAGTPVPLPPGFDQVEAGALSPDGRTLYVGTEGQPGRWARIDLP
jgi:hypothetical protein